MVSISLHEIMNWSVNEIRWKEREKEISATKLVAPTVRVHTERQRERGREKESMNHNT